MQHNKLTFTREYCLARRIPYRIKGNTLFIDGILLCYNLYNLTYADILRGIDTIVVYDDLTCFYKNIDSFWRD